MSWQDHLDENEFTALVKRGSTRKAAVEAMQVPGYADEFKRLVGAYLDTTDDGELYAVIPYGAPEATFARLVLAALGIVSRESVDAQTGEEPPEQDDLVGGWPYSKMEYEAAGKLHAAQKMTVGGVESRAELSRRRAHRLYRQFQEGAVLYDNSAGLHPGPGYRWDPSLRDEDPPRYKLIRG